MIPSLMLMGLMATPKAPEGGSFAAYLPKLEAVAQLLPFFRAAGSRAPLLQPEAFRSQVHPLLDVDVTSREALALVGIDPKASLTRSRLGEATVACVTVRQIDRYRKAVDEKLVRLGALFEQSEGGVSVYASRDILGRVLGAYVLHGNESCAISGHGHSVEEQLPALSKAVTKRAQGPGYALAAKLPGVMQLIFPSGAQHGALSLSAQGLVLTVEGRARGTPLAQFAGGGPSPFGALSAPGLAIIRARFAQSSMPGLVGPLMKQLPESASLLALAQKLAPSLTGNAALLLGHVSVTGSLRSRAGRTFSLRSALLLEVSNPAAVAKMVQLVDPQSLNFGQGALSVSLEGSVLVVANDHEVRASAVGALKRSAGKQAHGVEFEVDPKLLAAGLQQVPLLEAIQASELAALVAANAELGPLLMASGRVTGFLDSSAGGLHSGRMTWPLDESELKP